MMEGRREKREQERELKSGGRILLRYLWTRVMLGVFTGKRVRLLVNIRWSLGREIYSLLVLTNYKNK